MYFELIQRYVNALESMQRWLDKAEAHATAKKFDVAVLMQARLAPDMGAFVYQVQSACDYIKGAAGWLSTQQAPRHVDDEQTLDEVRARIRKTLAFLHSIPEASYAQAEQQRVRVSWSPEGKVLPARDYVLQVSLPNVYFHVMAAYAILRHNGVELGKLDFLGRIDWVDA